MRSGPVCIGLKRREFCQAACLPACLCQNGGLMIFRYGLGLALMYGSYFLLSRLWLKGIFEKKAFSEERRQLVYSLLLYIPCLLLLRLMIGGGGAEAAERLPWTARHYALIFAALFFALPLMALTALCRSLLGGSKAGSAVSETKEPLQTHFDVLRLLLLAPFMEELFARKFLYDRLAAENLMPFIFFSAFCFGLIHLISGQAEAAVGTFYAGGLFALIYAAGGTMLWPAVCHAGFNLFSAVLPGFLELRGKKGAGLWRAGLAVLGTAAMVYLLRYLDLFWPPERRGSLKEAAGMVLGNPGSLILAAVMISIYIYLRLKANEPRLSDSGRKV